MTPGHIRFSASSVTADGTGAPAASDICAKALSTSSELGASAARLAQRIQGACCIAVFRLQAREQRAWPERNEIVRPHQRAAVRFGTPPCGQLLLRSLERCRARVLLRARGRGGAEHEYQQRSSRSRPSSPALLLQLFEEREVLFRQVRLTEFLIGLSQLVMSIRILGCESNGCPQLIDCFRRGSLREENLAEQVSAVSEIRLCAHQRAEDFERLIESPSRSSTAARV